MWTEGKLLEHGQLTSSYTTKTNEKPPPNKGRLQGEDANTGSLPTQSAKRELGLWASESERMRRLHVVGVALS